MNKYSFISLAIAFIALILIGRSETLRGQVSSSASSSLPTIASCEGSRALFPLPPASIPDDKDLIDVWIESYHGTVSDIIDLHMAPQKYTCSEDTARAASVALLILAGYLEPLGSGSITEDDLAAVLLEYLRIYECTLREHEPVASLYVEDDLKAGSGVNIVDLGKETMDRTLKITEELRTARPTMHRLLATIGTLDRLRPLQSSLECFQRSSLDIRNLMGLTADVSACLPRALDARGSLRDLSSPVQ